jgi:shikimate kinase
MKRGDRPVIIIVGPKHSGKTCAGKALARLWEEDGAPAPEGGKAAGPEDKKPAAAVFVDLDQLVEERNGKSPRLLYREGPEVFRRAEAEALRALLEENHPEQRPAGDPEEGVAGGRGRIIAAAGGGLADNREALEILRKNPQALAVYIEVPAETAWERIRTAAEKTGELPPFLNTENPRETHRRLHERRGEIYRELAEITITAGNTPEETAAALLRQFSLEQ